MSNAPSGAASPFHVLLTAAVATAFATGSALAPIAYAAGSDALAVNLTRAVVATLAALALLLWQGAAVSLPPYERRVALALGVVNAAYSYGLYGAIAYIPVAMAVLIFYTYPLVTALIEWASGAEKPSARGIGALLLGLIGVALVVGAPDERPDWRGVALAVGAALGFALVLAVNVRILRGRDSRPITMHILASASVSYALVSIALWQFAIPRTTEGWLAFWLIPVFYSFAFVALFVAVSALGALRTALIMNFEPVASAILAWMLLGQRLGIAQVLGAVLVVAGITLAARRRARP